ncbi:NADPH-dependent F420 reductase [Adhaeribacter aquaticus]|uniref:NADPH-dependent F420 reductase n=1 Tax=Adhaeribacter aquaticus TaxID=299567 RepID=UPI00040F809F|nr:NAD(P)-binding domain-containing protein [Adhaeribacter aquaticus]
MKTIGIIGAGKIGKAFAAHVAKAGYPTIISNSRGPASLTETVEEIGHGIKAGTTAEAASADIIFLSVNWNKVEEALAGISNWENKIVIDATNAILPGFVPADLSGKVSSEIIASLVPGAQVVKAFNTLLAAVLASDPRDEGGNRILFYSGNNAEAKKAVQEIINKIGFAAIDLGKLDEGGRLQQFPGGPLAAQNLIKIK